MKVQPLRVLLTFTGLHDPFANSAIAGTAQDGPILTLLRYRSFERVVLLSTPRTVDITAETEKEIAERYPATEVSRQHIDLVNPTEYAPILDGLRRMFQVVSDSSDSCRYFVATASGTPQMHASWLLLIASGEVPATCLYVRQPQFVQENSDPVVEIDPSQAHFPTVRFRPPAAEIDEENVPDATGAAERLGIVGKHPAFLTTIETAAVLAESSLPVVIRGETGTGKEKIARLIHELSDRRKGPFIAVNCAAIAKELAESYLFGHQKGAFTGATEKSIGRFEAAHLGTLFLDEISEMPLDIQAKILRAVQEGTIDPLGASQSKAVNVRLIAATNQDLEQAAKQGKFREDLFYRLQVGDIRIPPLRERRSDIPLLSIHFLDEINAGLRPERRFKPEALHVICGLDWPGNVRQLSNTVQRAAVLARQGEIAVEHLSIPTSVSADAPVGVPDIRVGFSAESYIAGVRKSLYEHALDLAGGNQSEAARLLGVTPQAVSKFLKGGPA